MADFKASLAASRVMDHALLDREGRRAGRVDDLLFEVRPAASAGAPPVIFLRELVSGPLPRALPRPLGALARIGYRALGLSDPRPAHVDWCHVKAIDALVHLDVQRDKAGLRAVDEVIVLWLRR